jgi:diguanylate cyclase (GGDEF)-like protein/PAS domain S-box-containing protein
MPDAEKFLPIRLSMAMLIVGAGVGFVALPFVTPDQAIALTGALMLAGILLVFFFRHIYQNRLRELRMLSSNLTERTHALEQRTNELKRAQAVANIGSWVSDLAAHQITMSLQTCHILGLEPCRTITCQAYMALVHPDDRAGVQQAWQLALNRQDFDEEHRVIVRGTVRWIRQIAELDFDDTNHAVSAVGTTQDVTELKSAQLALKTSEERYRTLIEWSPEAILVHRGGKILYANPAAIRLFGAAYAQLLIDTPTAKLIHPDSLAEQSARMKSIGNHEKIQPMVEAKFLRLDGSVIDVEVQGTAIDFDDELAIHVVIHDITQRKKMESQVRRLAFYDALTQLPNRRLLTERLTHALAACRRSGNFGAVMFLDLDNFKPLNDHFGHAMGDLLLIEVARRLKACVREMDTVARFGGDEFVVVVEDLATDRLEAERLAHHLAEKMRAGLSEPYILKKPNAEGLTKTVTHRCTTSIGVVMTARNEDSPDDLVKWADAAMYQAKNSGRNQIKFFSAQDARAEQFSE